MLLRMDESRGSRLIHQSGSYHTRAPAYLRALINDKRVNAPIDPHTSLKEMKYLVRCTINGKIFFFINQFSFLFQVRTLPPPLSLMSLNF